MNCALGFHAGNGCIHVFWSHVSTEQQTAGQVLAMRGITLHHLVGRLKAGVCDLSNSQLLVVGLLSGDERCLGGQWEVDTWVGHQVGLEFCQIHV